MADKGPPVHNMFSILNVEPNEYCEEARRILQECAVVTEALLSRAELLARISEYDGLILRLGHRIDREVFAAASRLKFVATNTTGLNHIDVEEAQRRGIEVISLRGERAFLNTVTATAEHTWGLLLALIRHIPDAYQHVRARGWERDCFKGIELSGRTLGVIGYGRLGSKVAQYGIAFGMRVLANDITMFPPQPGLEFVTLDDALRQSDIVSLHVPCAPSTFDLIGQRELALMKPGAYFVNTSRGEILNEDALLNALDSNHLAGAALDVLRGENIGDPDWMRHDRLIEYARTHSNLLITPHIGGATADSMAKTERFIAQKIRARFYNQYPSS